MNGLTDVFLEKYMRKFVLLLIISISTVFTGCFGRILEPNALNRLDRPDLFSVFASSYVPISPDGEWDEIYEIETDSYGRILFVYVTYGYNNKINHRSNWAFVCQKSDEHYVYYYDNCYINIQDKELTNSELDTIKQMNDWNEPLNESKCSKTNQTEEFRRFDDINEPLVLDLFECDEDCDEIVYPICIDTNGLRLYYYLQIESNTRKFKDSYIVIKLSNGSFVFEKNADEVKSKDQLEEFKIRYNWDSSNCSIIQNQP